MMATLEEPGISATGADDELMDVTESESEVGVNESPCRRRRRRLDKKERRHQCPHCAKTFRFPNKLRLHVERTHSKLYECQSCGERFDRQRELRTHWATAHPRPKLLHRCTVCGHDASSTTDLKRHIRANHIEGDATCPIEGCGIRFALCKLRAHIREKHEPKEDDKKTEKSELKCAHCDYKPTDAKDLWMHERSAHERGVHCPVVGCESGTRPMLLAQLIEHLDVFHAGELPQSHREKTRKRGAKAQSVEPVLDDDEPMEHSGEEEDEDDEASSTADATDGGETELDGLGGLDVEAEEDEELEDNNTTTTTSAATGKGRGSSLDVTIDQGSFVCGRCGKRAATRRAVARHVARVHDRTYKRDAPRKKPFECSESNCRRSFRTQAELIDHGNTHTGATPYECARCERHFQLRRSLAVHLRKYHFVSIKDLAKVEQICGKT